jgi:hypothetical protein
MRIVAALVISLAASVAAYAQGVVPIRDALTMMPGQLLDTPSPVQFSFVDVAALRELGGREGIYLTLAARAIVGDALPHFVALRARGVDYWAARSLLDLANSRYFAASGLQPLIWGLDSKDTAIAAIADLDALDFEAVGEGMLSNGGARDPADVESFDPWRSGGRHSSFIAAKGPAIIQAIAPEWVEATLNDEPSMAESDVVKAALGGIEARLGDGTLVQAVMITPLVGLGGVDTEMLLNRRPTLEETRKKLEAELEPGTEGMPSYLGGFIGDAQGEHPGVLISLAYPDCATAERAAAQMADRWTFTMREDLRGDVEHAAVEASSGLCAATLMVTVPTTDNLSNPTFQALIESRQYFEVLQIGRVE